MRFVSREQNFDELKRQNARVTMAIILRVVPEFIKHLT